MEVRVWDTAVLFLRAVKSEVSNHAFCHKLLLHELPCLLYTSFYIISSLNIYNQSVLIQGITHLL